MSSRRSPSRIPVLFLSAFLLASCGIGPVLPTEGQAATPTSAVPIVLRLWHVWPTDSESNRLPLENAVRSWNASNPDVRIVTEAAENEAYKLKIRTAVATNEMPDIFFCWGAGFAEPFVQAGKVLALDPYLEDGTTDKLIPGSLDNFTYGGKVYGLPIYVVAGVLYCNTEIFEAHDLALPVTFDDLIGAVKIFKADGLIPMAVGEKDGWPGMFYQNILAIRTAGKALCESALNKESSFDQPAFIESAERLRELIEAGAFDPRCMNVTRDESERDFKNGNAAMYFNGNWVAGSLDKNDCPVKGKVRAIAFPQIPGAHGDPSGFVGGAIDTFMIAASTKHPDEAVEALKWIDETFCRNSYLSGATEPAWKLEDVTTPRSSLESDISELLKTNSGFVLAWDTFLTPLEAERHINLVAMLFSGDITPEGFASEMQKINVP